MTMPLTRALELYRNRMRELVALAARDGVVLTAHTTPGAPLAMGHYSVVVEVRPDHAHMKIVMEYDEYVKGARLAGVQEIYTLDQYAAKAREWDERNKPCSG